MTDRSSTPLCDDFVREFDEEMLPQEVIGRLRALADFREPHKLGPEPQRAWRAACHDGANIIERSMQSEIASSVTPSAVPTREWITCPATGQTCHEYCDPGQGDVCAKDGGPTPMFAPSAGVQSATGPILPWTPKEARRLLDFQHAHCTDDHEEAYHQIYWLVTDRAADPFHPWAEVEEAAKLAPADRKETDD